MDRQVAVAAELDDLFSDLDHVAGALTGGGPDALRHRMLAEAFRGELTHQDPSDEPASALLGRIRAERAAATPAKPARRRSASSPAP